MQDTDVPSKFPIPFANSASGSDVRDIPLTATDPDQASLTLGFPPATFAAIGAGGVPPDGRDFNGILKQLSQWAQWLSAGAPVRFDSAFSTAIGGYPRGTIVESATTPGFYWFSTAQNNVTDPDAAGAGWVGFMPTGLRADDTGTVNAVQATFSPAPPSMASLVGVSLRVKVANSNTIATPTLTVNGFAPVNITNPDHSALFKGQMAVGAEAEFVFDGVRAQLTSIASNQQSLPGTGARLVYTSSSQLTLQPVAGGNLWIDGTNYAIPAGLVLAAAGLTPATFYYVYAYISAGTMTLEASTTTYALATNGIPQKSGDITRTLVGACYVLTGPIFASSDTQRLVMSWFNQIAARGLNVLTTSPSTNNSSYVELTTGIRIQFISWVANIVTASFSGAVTATASNPGTAIGFDGTTPEEGFAKSILNAVSAASVYVEKTGLTEAAIHYVTLLGASLDAVSSATWLGGSTPGTRGALYLEVSQ